MAGDAVLFVAVLYNVLQDEAFIHTQTVGSLQSAYGLNFN